MNDLDRALGSGDAVAGKDLAFAADSAEPTLLRRLRRLLPKTMVSLVATSKLLAMAPLLVTLILVGVALDKLLILGQELVSDGQRLEQLGAQMQDQLDDLERVARQFVALEDPALLVVFNRRLDSAQETAGLMERESLPEAVKTPAHTIVEGLAALEREWSPDPLQREALLPLIERIHALSGEADRIVAEGRLAIYARVQHLQDQATLARRALTLAALTVVALTVALTLGLSLLITRPLQGLRASIAALGTSNYENPVVIEYPRELARLGEKLDWLRRRLRELEADKERFLRHVSHELKTPLASLREGTDLLLEESFGTLNPRQAEVAQILAESAQDLDAQIRNLLAYAEWSSGQRDLTMSWIDSRILIDEVLNSQRLPLSKRRLDTQVDLRTPHLYGQRWSLRVSLSNLLSNAIKHAPADSVIDIVVDRRKGRCCLSVRDRGRGVPPADRERILLPFVRGGEPEEAGARGTGIGLSIVSETVRSHGGVLEVQDAKPGARFVLDWPCPLPSV